MTALPPIAAVPLAGSHVRLEPLSPAHAEGLAEIMRADPHVFRYFPPPYAPQEASADAMRRYIDIRTSPEQGVGWAMVETTTGRVAGSSCFLDIRQPHRGLEIGATFIHPAFRSSAINPEAKLLMLAHAFETLGMLRVQLKCDGRNVHSQRAIEKLGATREGVLRAHMVMSDGFVRDTVMYSILAAEWPRVCAGLQARLAAFPTR